MNPTQQDLAWFWTIPTATLWIGFHGVKYNGSFEIERCGHSHGLDAALEVFTRCVAPYASAVIPSGKISVLRIKTVCLPSQLNV